VATPNESSQAGWPHETLEQRVQRLEDAVASLQDTRPLEERISERVAARFQLRPGPPPDVADKVVTSLPPPPVPNPLPSAAGPPPASVLAPHSWLLFDVLTELRAMVRMFFDVRYNVAWTTRLTVIVLAVLLALSEFWLKFLPCASIWLVGEVLDKLVVVALAFLIYKALSREAQRYLQFRAARRRDR
jgi:hypothetical protein